MAKYTPTPVGSTLSNTAGSQINANLQRISEALEKTLSRDGEAPNQMQSDLDMNHQDILNTKDVHADRLFLDGKQVTEVSEFNPGNFATAAQGAKADTAVQPGSLGTAAYEDAVDFATSAQGTKADTALQPTNLDLLPDVNSSLARVIGEGPDGAVGISLYDILDNRSSKIPYTSALVDGSLYSHFPVMAEGRNVLGILYHRGRNHGQSDPEAVCLSQTPSAGGTQSLTINGNEAAGGSVSVGGATQVTITSAGNDTGRTFTVTGTLDGVAVVRSGAGGNATTVTLSGNIDTITLVQVDGNTAGAVTVGLLRIASDIVYSWSEDGGKTFTGKVVLGDGMTDGQTRFYYPSLGRRRDGSLIAVMAAVDVTTGAWTRYQTTSFNGREDWTPLQVMSISGPQGTAAAFYGQIKTSPKGRLAISQYAGDDNYAIISNDDGNTWVSNLVVNSNSPEFSEQAIAFIDEDRMVTVLRVDGVSSGMRQSMSTDGGATWSVPAETNLPASGGYASHELNTIYVGGTCYVILTYMARDVGGVDPPTINTICSRWVTATDVMAATTNWSDEFPILGSLLNRSGYPSIYINQDSGIALMAYGKETGTRTAEVRTLSVDFAAKISGWVENPFLNRRVEDDTAVSTIPLPNNSIGYGFLGFGAVSRTAIFAWDTIGTPEVVFLVEGSGSAIVDVTTGVLTGTTGADTHVTLSIDTATRRLYFENRLGSGGNLTLHISLGRRI